MDGLSLTQTDIDLVCIWYSEVECFSIENASKRYFFSDFLFIFYINTSKNLKNINLLPFQIKNNFKNRL